MKRMIKLIISLIYLGCLMFPLAIRKLTGRKISNIVVLYYHNVKNEEKEKFLKQVNLLLSLSTVVSADINVTPEPGKHYIIITFDDAYESTLLNAVPQLVKRQIPFTIFVPTDFLGKYPDWGKIPDDIRQNEKIVNSDQLKKINLSGNTIGSHSASHPVFTTLDDHAMEQELKDSKEYLESICGKSITMFSFPYGIYDHRAIANAVKAGYNKIFTIIPEIIHDYPVQKVIGRINVSPGDWKLEFLVKILGGYSWQGIYIKFMSEARWNYKQWIQKRSGADKYAKDASPYIIDERSNTE